VRYECEAGYYGDETGLSESKCSGICEAGYWCPRASTSGRQNECGDPSKYCPIGSSSPLTVESGYYTQSQSSVRRSSISVYGNEIDQVNTEIPSGTWYYRGPTVVGGENVREEQHTCEPGHYCVDGERYECPPGVFGSSHGITNAACDGPCEAGFFCNAAATVSTENECGSVDLYCEIGTAVPTNVRAGFFSTPLNASDRRRSGEEVCPMGRYCTGGIPFPCPAGTFGSTRGLAGPLNRGHNTDGRGHFRCSGWCPAGHACPLGTSDPDPCPIGTYAQAGASECTECPPRYGNDFSSSGIEPCVTSRACCGY